MSDNEVEFIQGKLTLLFDEPYWVGIFERSSPEGYSAGRFVFGGEPTDAELFGEWLN